MLTPAAKRRRAEAASATLSRPFRSPAVRGKPAEVATAPSSSQSLGLTPEKTESPKRKNKRPRQSSLSGPPSSQLRKHPTKPISQAPLSLGSLIDQFTLELDTGDEAIEEAQKAARRRKDEAGQVQAASSRDTAKKADMYDEMPALIAKWREAGRLAAEEVYEFVARRIAGAGGIKAWQAMAAPPPPEEDRGCFERRGDDDDEGCDYERKQAEEEREEQEEEEEKKSQVSCSPPSPPQQTTSNSTELYNGNDAG